VKPKLKLSLKTPQGRYKMKKKILILANHDVGLYNFRKELLENLIAEGYDVFISCPPGENIEKLVKSGCKYLETEFNRHGKNPINELKLINYYRKIMTKIQPDIIFGYTIKPNIYGAIAAKKDNIPFVANITGLGTAVENSGILQKILIQMYKFAFSNIQTVFFQNKENSQFFIDHNIAVEKHELLPGSGVNLDFFYLQDYPSTDETIDFVFISRIMKEKGIDQYLKAANYITIKYPYTRFHVCGFCEEEYEDILEEYHNKGVIIYHGMVNNIRGILKTTHCTIHPTYYPEGLSNVLLESAASGRPIISTDRSGTRETIDDGVNGYLVEQKNEKDLIEKIEKFIGLSFENKKTMGLAGRKKVEREFDRKIVIKKYMEQLEEGAYD